MKKLKVSEIKSILEPFKSDGSIAYYSILREDGSTKVVIITECGNDINNIRDLIVKSLDDTSVDVVIKSPVNKTSASNVRETLGRLKFGKKGFDKRKGWDKNG